LGSKDHKNRLTEGAIAQARGDFERAREIYTTLLSEGVENPADIYCNLSTMAFSRGNPEAAEAHARHAITLDPENANNYNSLGIALRAMQRPAEAIDAFKACTTRDRNHSIALSNLAHTCAAENRHREAIDAIGQALKVKPGSSQHLEFAIYLKLECADWDGLEQMLSHLEAHLAAGRPVNPYTLFSCCLEPSQLQRAAQNFALERSKQVAHLPPFAGPDKPVTKGRKIRVGFMSCTIRSHATGYLMRQMLASYDRDRFEFHLYNTSPYPLDDFAKVLRSQFTTLLDLAHLGDGDAVDRIRDCEPDIMIDVDGYANGGRTNLTAARCAPIQINWLGFMSTMGAPFVDYILADRLVIPEDFREWYDETLIDMPMGFFPNDRQRKASDKFKNRTDLGLPETGPILCTFNQTRKVTPQILDCWAEVLKRVPDATLWMWDVNALGTQNLRRELADRGVEMDRVVFSPSMPGPDHLCRYRFADLFLDTFPYNGHTMASDVLFMNVPIVTIGGKSMPSRLCASLLARLGLQENIAESYAGYADRIVELASNPDALVMQKQKLTAALDQSQLLDGTRFVRGFEAALAELVEEDDGQRVSSLK
jgi:predicted O-linked N-acetylglucosamine transferase (SPINDLY family)